MIAIDENGRVGLLPETMEYPEVIQLKNNSTSSFFNDAIKYVYHAYKTGHPLDIYPPTERCLKVCNTYFTDYLPEDFENNEFVKSLIKRFMDESMSINEISFYSVRKDFEELVTHLREIPLFHKQTKEVTVPIVLTRDGQVIRENYTAKVEVRIDNSVEKFVAISNLNKLLEIIEKYDKKLQLERREKKKGSKKRLFDVQ